MFYTELLHNSSAVLSINTTIDDLEGSLISSLERKPVPINWMFNSLNGLGVPDEQSFFDIQNDSHDENEPNDVVRNDYESVDMISKILRDIDQLDEY